MPSTLRDPAYRAFVEHLAGLRRAAGLSQRALAERLGKPQSYVHKTEAFDRRMDPAEFWRWATALGADPRAAYAAVLARLEGERREG